MRMRTEMLIKDTKFNGMIEMDESYFGGKARKKDKGEDNDPNLSTTTLKRGRGTNKVLVAGMVQRKGMVKTKLIDKLTKRNLLKPMQNKKIICFLQMVSVRIQNLTIILID